MLCALALTVVPVDDVAVVGTAEAVVCRPADVECHEQRLRCYVRALTEGGVCPA